MSPFKFNFLYILIAKFFTSSVLSKPIFAGVISSDSPLYFASKSKYSLWGIISVGGKAVTLSLNLITPTEISLPIIHFYFREKLKTK